MKKLFFTIVLLWGIVSSAQIQAEKTGGQIFEGYTTTTLNGLSTKPAGLLVRNTTDNNALWYWNGSEYKNLLSGGATFSTLLGSARDNADLDAELDLKANDDEVVHLTGDETVDGTKLIAKQLRLDYTLGATNETNSPLQIALATNSVISATPPAGFGGIYFNNTGEVRFQTATEGAGDGGNLGLEFDQLTATKDLIFTDSDITWGGTSLLGGGGTDDQTAVEVPITDSGDYFTGTNVEAALQELGAGTAGGSFGIVAEGMFDTTSGTGTYTITHSLGYAPAVTRIQIQQYDKPGCCANQPTAIENITTTTFDVKTTTTSGFYYAWRIFGTGSTTPLDYTEVASGLDTELGSSDWRTGGDTVDATSVNAAGAVMNSDTSTASMSFVVDEDDMVSNSATKVPTQQSVKAYVDANSGGGGLQMHPDSPVTIDSLYVGTVAQIAAAGLGTDVLSIPTDAPPATTFTGTVIPLDGYYTIDNTSTDTATWTLNATVRNGAAFDILINQASEPAITGATQIPGTQAFSTNTLSVIKGTVIQGTVYYYFLDLE